MGRKERTKKGGVLKIVKKKKNDQIRESAIKEEER